MRNEGTMLRMVAAIEADYNTLIEMHRHCTKDLDEKGIFQWTDDYPSPETIRYAIENGCQWKLMDGEEWIGGVVLNEEQSDEWQTISWGFDGPALVIHALIINPEYQGRGYGQQAIDIIEEYGIKEHYVGIRLDVFTENPGAIGLYKKNGYKFLGEVVFDSKPEGHQRYACCEKQFS